MGKKGQLVVKALFVLIASGMVIFAFLSAGKSYGNQKAFYKLAVAKDLALTIDIAYSLAGDLEYTYPNDISGYGVDIKGSTIKVYDRELVKLIDPTTASYGFVGLSTDTIDAKIKGHKFITVNKTGNKIKIGGIDK